jgi:hypothetical protein
LLKLKTELDAFAKSLLDVRNKVLSHNDLETILAEATLGEFPAGEDVKYFDDLQKFVNIVSEKVRLAPYPFYIDTDVEADALLALLRR